MYNKICGFSSYFNDNRNSINRAGFFNLDDVIQQLHDILKSIHPSLCFECDFPEGQNKQFFLSADGISDAFTILNCVYHYKREIE
ncbi:MAG: hypothetical protein PG981_001507 [Wolbachia endosymbiont of Ctenocephalides orientis wCori]|nr:MAG: hypothetical protein PG981_001507 [Wolbachia endosymbiont of Ctenocephalides orientis wCori]